MKTATFVTRALGWYYAATGILRTRRTSDRVLIGPVDQSGTLSVDSGSSTATAISTAGRIVTQGIAISDGGAAWIVLPETGTDPAVANLTAGCALAMYMKANQLTFAFNCGGTINYLKITLDGQDVEWTQGTGRPQDD